MEKVIIYKGQDHKDEIAFKVTVRQCLEWGGLGMCDLCGSVSKIGCFLYMCPEIGYHAICQKCFDEHKERVKWYECDKDIILDMISNLLKLYIKDLSDEDYSKIKQFKQSIM